MSRASSRLKLTGLWGNLRPRFACFQPSGWFQASGSQAEMAGCSTFPVSSSMCSTPPAHIRLPAETTEVDLHANVVMMCGCPIEPKGLWDADKLEVKAIVKRNGERIAQLDLAYAGETSQFATKVPVEAPGDYEVIVFAHDPRNGNTGIDRTTFIASKG